MENINRLHGGAVDEREVIYFLLHKYITNKHPNNDLLWRKILYYNIYITLYQ